MAYWMGDENSWTIVMSAEKQVAEGRKAGIFSMNPSEDDLPPIYERVGNVGVINIEGSLVNGSAGWSRLFGVTGYDDILSAALKGAADPEATSLMFKVSSGGGHVHGLAEFSNNLNTISQSKPSLTYTPDTMASAAYWAGAAINGPIVMASTAEVGSLGVMQVQKNISKMLEMEGISMTIHRSGDMKARVNPIEELTPEAKAHLDSQLADLHGMFRKHVAARRPGMTAEDLGTATDGRTFLGKRAIDAKLADSIGSFDMALKLLDKSSRKKDTSSNFKGASMHMTPAQQAKYFAALQGGATIEAALQAAGVVATAEQTAELVKAAAEFKAESDAIAAAAAAKKATDDAAAAALASTGAGADDKSAAAVIDLLKSQLTTAQAAERAASVELTALKATTQTNTANHDALLKIARGSLAHMMIPMGGSAASADAMDATTVIAEHARVETLFKAKFPVGQVSQTTEQSDKGANEIPMEFRFRTNQKSK